VDLWFWHLGFGPWFSKSCGMYKKRSRRVEMGGDSGVEM
jgi:hypothetical protein